MSYIRDLFYLIGRNGVVQLPRSQLLSLGISQLLSELSPSALRCFAPTLSCAFLLSATVIVDVFQQSNGPELPPR